jgi:hypothetical protein
MAQPEQLARENIDALLTTAGWHVCDVDKANIHAARGVAIREFPLPGYGFADYLFYVDGKAAGVIEAKKEGHTLSGVETQSDKYTLGLPTGLPVKGDSMVDAGIHDGDIVAVERGRPAVAGDFVVAIVDNEFTLKELAIERKKFVLKPHNSAYPIIRPLGELEVFGVVVGLVRRFKD